MLLSELFYRNATYSKNRLEVNTEMNEIQILSIFYNIFNDNGEKVIQIKIFTIRNYNYVVDL